MVRIATFLAFSALALHASIVGALESGIYHILNYDGDRALGIPPTPPIYPPPDIPVAIFQFGSPFVVKWQVKKTGPDTYLISAGPRESDYKFAHANQDVIASVRKAPEEWEVTSAGDGLYVIKRPNEDEVVTFNNGNFPPLILSPADGSPEQRFYFQRIDREYDNYRWKGSRNRMCVQKKW